LAAPALDEGSSSYKAVTFVAVSFPSIVVGAITALLVAELAKSELVSGATGAAASAALFFFLKSKLEKALRFAAKALE